MFVVLFSTSGKKEYSCRQSVGLVLGKSQCSVVVSKMLSAPSILELGRGNDIEFIITFFNHHIPKTSSHRLHPSLIHPSSCSRFHTRFF